MIAVIGVVQQAFTVTGMGFRLSELLIMVAAGKPFIVLIMAMVIAILLGMGLPTPIAYLISGVFVAPAMVEVGFSELSAHFFVFFFAIKSGSTPPIAMVAVVAAGIADSNWLKTAWLSFVYSWPGFFIAFAWMYYPSLLLQGSWSDILIRLVCTGIGVAGLSYSFQRHYLVKLKYWEIVLLSLGSLILIFVPASLTLLIGLGLIGFVVFLQFRKRQLIFRYDIVSTL
jgi:TRAP-type uncharacterized transport system fused permease subunit